MSVNAITADRLSKAFHLGCRGETPDTLVGAVRGWTQRPLKNLLALWRMGHVQADAARSDDVLWALRDVSFEIPVGEVVGIIGRNGAGKSTLLKLLSRISEPTSGEAAIRGRVSSLLEVGTGFHPELTGRDNIYMNGTILGMSKQEIDAKFDEIVEFSGVAKFLETPIKRYSSGMQVRLAFAVAANLNPEILIIDEVLAVGDAEFQRKCLGKMQDVATSGRTVLFVSHNMSAINQLCSSAMLLRGGSLTSQGNVQEVIEQYLAGLFATSAEVGDDEVRLRLWTQIEGGGGNTWDVGTSLLVKVDVQTQDPVIGPAIDLQLHSEHGRIAAAHSDRFAHGPPGRESRRWRFNFRITNTGIASSYVTIDVGFRFNSSTRYLGRWHSVAAIPVGPIPTTFATGRLFPLALPCEVVLGEAA